MFPSQFVRGLVARASCCNADDDDLGRLPFAAGA